MKHKQFYHRWPRGRKDKGPITPSHILFMWKYDQFPEGTVCWEEGGEKRPVAEVVKEYEDYLANLPAARYFYREPEGAEQGPISWDELYTLYDEEKLHKYTLYHEDGEDWASLRSAYYSERNEVEPWDPDTFDQALYERYCTFFQKLVADYQHENVREYAKQLLNWAKENNFDFYPLEIEAFNDPHRYFQHKEYLLHHIRLKQSKRHYESYLYSIAHPASKLVRTGFRENPRDWQARWEAAWQSCGGQGALYGEMVALNDSPIWSALSDFGLPYPPFAYGSGMGVSYVTLDEAKQLGLINEAVIAQINAGRRSQSENTPPT